MGDTSATGRKAHQRERQAALGIKRVEVQLSERERGQLKMLCQLRATCSEPYTADEYISTLIRRDWERWLAQEAELKQVSCEHCQQEAPSGCRGAFYGEAACWLTQGKKDLAL